MKSVIFTLDPQRPGEAAAHAELDSPSTLVIAFGAPELAQHPALLAELAAAFPRSVVVGCSTAGEISGDKVLDGSLSVAVARFEHTELRLAMAPVHQSSASREAGELLSRTLAAPNLRAVFMLSDGLSVNGSELTHGMNAHLPPGTVVTGGLAGDGDRFKSTWVLHEGKATASVVLAVGLYGDRLQVGHGSRGGWEAFGPRRLVTRSRGNVLYELGGRPALAVYREYLGELAAGLPATALLFPLAMRTSDGDTQELVRTILSIDDAETSMTFAGDIPEGAYVQLMRSNLDGLIDGANAAARQTGGHGETRDESLSIAVSCVGRRLVLGERAEEEVESALEGLPHATKLAGFYSYGEIAPGDRGFAGLHNQTMTLTTFWEAA